MEKDAEIQSFIYQQIADFSPYVTPETVVMVVSRNPKDENPEIDEDKMPDFKKFKHRIAIVLQEEDVSIEAEAYHNDLFEAIKQAKNSLINRLIEIQSEMENAEENRNNLINEYSGSSSLH